jgi:integrase
MQQRKKQYQAGSVVEDPRTHIWYFRWRDADGVRRAERIGKCKSRSAAMRKSDGMRLRINSPDIAPPITVVQVAQRYLLERLPERHSTSRGYKVKLKVICRDWGNKPMPLKPFEVEQWLKTVKKLRSEEVYAGRTREHFKALISTLHDLAMFWEYTPLTRNPMSLFKSRGSSKPVRPPVILTIEQFGALFREIKQDGEPYPTLVFLDACSGIRESELFGLRWRNIDWQRAEVSVEQAVVEGHEGATKSEASKARLPLDPMVVSVLQAWRQLAPYTGQDDFVFASTVKHGMKPLSGNSAQRDHLRPACNSGGASPVGLARPASQLSDAVR